MIDAHRPQVKAVNIPELERYTDVVVVPVKPTWAPRLGYVTFMTILSGGGES